MADRGKGPMDRIERERLERAERVVAAATELESRLWRPGVSEDDLTPEHENLIQALTAYNSAPVDDYDECD